MVKQMGSRNASRDRGAGFTYRTRSAEEVKKRAEQSGARFDTCFKPSADIYRPKVGEGLIRILPPTWDEAEHYAYDVWVHKFIGPDSSTYLCLKKMKGQQCPCCDEAKAAKDAGEDQEAKELSASKAAVAYVIDRDDTAKVPTASLWLMSWAQDRDIADLSRIKRSGKVLVIDHPDDGYDITVKRTGQGLKTRYQYIIDRDPSTIDDDQRTQDDILATIEENPIPDMLLYHSAEHMEAQLSGKKPTKDPELDDDNETPRRGRGGRDRGADAGDEEQPTRRGRGREEPADDEPPPRRGSSRNRDAEPADDEPAPRRGGRGGRAADDGGEEEQPRRGRGRAEADEPADDEPRRRGGGRAAAEEPEEAEEPRRGRRGAAADEQEDERPARRGRRDEPADDEPPARGGRVRINRDEPADEEPTPRRGGRSREPEADDEPAPRRGRAREEPVDDEPPARRGRR